MKYPIFSATIFFTMKRALNLFEKLLVKQPNCHGGLGHVLTHRLYANDDGQLVVDFIDFTIVPPGSSIGLHMHGENTERYIIVEGNGQMQIDGNNIAVYPGDIIENPHFAEHGLENTGTKDMLIIVYQTSKRG